MRAHARVVVSLAMAMGAIAGCGDEAAPNAQCAAASGVYRIDWHSLPEGCEVIAELDRIVIDFDDPCTALLSNAACGAEIRGLMSCAQPFEHGYALLFADDLWALPRGGTPPRLTGRVRVKLADRIESFAEGTARTCEGAADVELVQESTGLDAGVPRPDGARAAGDACLTTCAPGLLCVAQEEDRLGLGRCARPPRIGEPCARSIDARVAPICDASSYCAEGTCRATPALGEPCGASLHGAPPICGRDAYCDSSGVCTAHPTLGQPCTSDLRHPGATHDCALEACCLQRGTQCDAAEDAGVGLCVEEG